MSYRQFVIHVLQLCPDCWERLEYFPDPFQRTPDEKMLAHKVTGVYICPQQMENFKKRWAEYKRQEKSRC